MTQILEAKGIGSQADLKVGCAAAIFDDSGTKLLLTRRSDNGQWCLPGGGMDPGESATEACEREVFEETRLTGSATRLIGIYTSPDRITAYADGNRFQYVSLLFEVQVTDGEPGSSDETTDVAYFLEEEISGLDLMQNHLERIPDIFARKTAAFIR